jgi:isopentenyl-diphosphate delta-isomerase
MTTKKVIFVNDQDKIVGSGKIEEAIDKGLAVRIVRIFITNMSCEILLQRRSKKMKNSALKWDQSAAGHVDEGESYLKAAQRELLEEMGVYNVKLKRYNKYFSIDKYNNIVRKRYNVIYHGLFDGQINIDHDEVAEYKWVTFDELNKWIHSKDDFTKGFLEAYSIFIKSFDPTTNQNK